MQLGFGFGRPTNYVTFCIKGRNSLPASVAAVAAVASAAVARSQNLYRRSMTPTLARRSQDNVNGSGVVDGGGGGGGTGDGGGT